nr:response regulator [Pseudoalteromonas sp. S4488]
MNEEAVSKIFERFTQADTSTTRKYGGTGLGMSIALSLIKMMDGNIEITSSEGAGTKVEITLPLKPVDMVKVPKTQKSLSAPNLADKKILIAEDNPINKILIESMLKSTKAQLTIVENGQLAVNAVEKGTYDLILMDIHMPVMDGSEAQRLIRDLKPSLPVVALTANVMKQDVDGYLAQGFITHIAKPIDINDLYGSLKNILDS